MNAMRKPIPCCCAHANDSILLAGLREARALGFQQCPRSLFQGLRGTSGWLLNCQHDVDNLRWKAAPLHHFIKHATPAFGIASSTKQEQLNPLSRHSTNYYIHSKYLELPSQINKHAFHRFRHHQDHLRHLHSTRRCLLGTRMQC
jgi:hypothetical protein